MYVAITRARKRLYLSHSQTRMLHGQTHFNLRSRFFDELPEGALKWITPKSRGFGSGLATHLGADYSKHSPAPLPERKDASAHGLRSGMKVFHNKFGEGTVQTLEGVGADARAQINFPRHGVKWLALGVAKLTPIEGDQ